MNRESFWHGKPYYSLDAYCKNTFHHKCYKIALNAHMTCPNRDGRLDTRGCIFCSKGGSGDFAVPLTFDLSDEALSEELEQGLALFRDKKVGEHFIAYFQAYTNTYAPIPYLRSVFQSALSHQGICGISIGTRPDCLGGEVLRLLAQLKAEHPDKFIWVELGLQTIHEDTAAWIRRGYPLSVFEKGFSDLSGLGIPVVIHVILGLPGEDEERILQTIDYLNRLRPFGVKLQLLHILEGTDLAEEYRNGKVRIFTKLEYLSLLEKCIARLHPGIVIHRVTGDGAGKDLIAPDWSRNKKDVLNSLHRKLKTDQVTQGMDYPGVP